jgi:hypothetical protein
MNDVILLKAALTVFGVFGGAEVARGEHADADEAPAFRIGDSCEDLMLLTEQTLFEVMEPIDGVLVPQFCRLDGEARCTDYADLLVDVDGRLERDASGRYCRLVPTPPEDEPDPGRNPCYRHLRWPGGDQFICG